MFQLLLGCLALLGVGLYWYLAEDFEQSANQPWLSDSRKAQERSLARLREWGQQGAQSQSLNKKSTDEPYLDQNE